MKKFEMDFVNKSDFTYVGEKIKCHVKDESSIYVRYYSHVSSEREDLYNNSLHVHEYNELIFFLDDNLAMNINGNIVAPVCGDVIVTKSGEPHCSATLADGMVSYMQIDIPDDVFDNMPDFEVFTKCFRSRGFCENNLISPKGEDSEKLMKYALKLISLLNSNEHKRLLIYSYLIQFMYAVNDVFLKGQSGIEERILPDKVYRAINYMRENIQDLKSVEEVAEHINVSVSYLCRIFKKNIGYTPYEYLLFQRIECAKRLLVYKDKNVSEACFESGFGEYSSFISTFKKKVGMTPLEYKKNSMPN